MTAILCDEAIGDGAASPFGKVIALGYDDGPTTGAVECLSCSIAYRFVRLSTDVDGVLDRRAWDVGEELHVYGLAPLPAGAFEQIVRRLLLVERPRWPVWVPGMPVPSEELDRILDQDIDPLLEQAGRPQLIIATASLLQPFRAARHMEHAEQQSGRDWFSWLGFVPRTDATLAETGRA